MVSSATLFLPTAVSYLGVPGWSLFVLVGVFAIGMFAYEVSGRLHLVARGRPDDRLAHVGARIRTVLVNVFGQRRLLNDPYSGPMHFLIFWGFLILLLGNVNSIVAPLTGHVFLSFLTGRVYPVYALSQDLAEDLVILGVVGMAVRRWIMRPERLEQSYDAALILIFIFALMITDLLMGAVRFAIAPTPLEAYSPGAHLLSGLFAGLSTVWGRDLYALFFGLHYLAFLAILVEVPRSKHFHIFLAAANVFLKDERPKGGRLRPINFEDESTDHFGAGHFEDLSWKHLMDTFTCTECGRCQDACPAWASGKVLSPKNLMIDIRNHVMTSGLASPEERPALAGGVISEDVLWACTTCRACEEACPVFNEHVPDIVDMRRYLVLTEGTAPPEAQTFFANLEKAQNPWGRDPFDRTAWLKDLGVRTVDEVRAAGEEMDYLYFVGCMGGYDDHSRRVTRSLVRILQAAGIRFAILGPEEHCNGEAARRLGNEYLFQTLRDDNRGQILASGATKVLTTCPHCFNTFSHEYGLEALEVVHHSVLLEELLAAGRIPLTRPVARRVTYHDPCYLGRYNDIFDAPRTLLAGLGAASVEMPRHRERGLCCGAGGGRMWLEEDPRKRVNALRVAEAVDTGADTIATACPFCLVMMKDGLGERSEDAVEARDLAELVAEAMEPVSDSAAVSAGPSL